LHLVAVRDEQHVGLVEQPRAPASRLEAEASRGQVGEPPCDRPRELVAVEALQVLTQASNQVVGLQVSSSGRGIVAVP
jgi:hypothetical protein